MFFVFQILANFVFSIMGYLMMVSERSHHRDIKSEKIWNMPIHSKDIAFLNLNFPPFCAIFSDKNGGKLNFQNAIFWMDWYISKNFSPLTSLRWLLLETIIRYPIIQKQNLAGTLWRHFPAKNAKIWKTKNVRFFGMVISILLQNFKWIALKPIKDE